MTNALTDNTALVMTALECYKVEAVLEIVERTPTADLVCQPLTKKLSSHGPVQLSTGLHFRLGL